MLGGALALFLGAGCDSHSQRVSFDSGGPDGTVGDAAVLAKEAGAPMAPDLSAVLEVSPPIPDSSMAGDLKPDVPADLGLDTPLPLDSSMAGDLKSDAPADLGLDSPLPDSSTAGDLGTEPTDTGKACFWQTPGGMYVLKHFKFLLTTPDGQEQSPPRTYLTPDAAVKPINDFEGRVASVEGNQFTVDSCLSPSSCQPSLYRFTLCGGSIGPCTADNLPTSLPTAIPSGRRVRILWYMENEVPGFCPGLYWLAVYDAEPGASKGNILFLGSGGYQPNATGASIKRLGELPFSVSLRALSCGSLGDARRYGDDYAFEFTPKNGNGAPLRLATGETGSFEFTTGSGSAQRLQIRCLDAVQPGATDDYWNWDFWAVNQTALAPPTDASSD
jgi:hypothetical protein